MDGQIRQGGYSLSELIRQDIFFRKRRDENVKISLFTSGERAFYI